MWAEYGSDVVDVVVAGAERSEACVLARSSACPCLEVSAEPEPDSWWFPSCA